MNPSMVCKCRPRLSIAVKPSQSTGIKKIINKLNSLIILFKHNHHTLRRCPPSILKECGMLCIIWIILIAWTGVSGENSMLATLLTAISILVIPKCSALSAIWWTAKKLFHWLWSHAKTVNQAPYGYDPAYLGIGITDTLLKTIDADAHHLNTRLEWMRHMQINFCG